MKYQHYLYYASQMRELRIGLTSDSSDDIDPSAMLGIGLQAFGMAITTPYPGTQLNFVTVFPKLTHVRWIRESCEPWDCHEPGALAQFHLCSQPYLLHSMHTMSILESIEVSFEDNLVISDRQTGYFKNSVAHLMSVDLSGGNWPTLSMHWCPPFLDRLKDPSFNDLGILGYG